MNTFTNKKIYNVAINDMPRGWASETENNKRVYKLWHSMISKCYSGYTRYSSYENCSVSPEWLYLSNFVNDLPKIPNYNRWEQGEEVYFDKDSLYLGNTEYRLGFVQFISKEDLNTYDTSQSPTKELSDRQRSISLYTYQEDILKNLSKTTPKLFPKLIRRGVDLALKEYGILNLYEMEDEK